MGETQALRIALLASSRFPIREPYAGGLEAHTASLARALHDRGHRIAVFAAPGSDLGFPVEELAVRPWEASEAARSDVAAPPALWMSEHHAYLTVMMRLLREGTDEFDVVLNNSLHHLPVAMAPGLPVPLVTTLHTPPVPWLESAIEVVGSGGTYVAVSAATGRSWRHCVATQTILNGVDTSAWTPGPGGPDAVWSGRIAPEKAPHDAIDAARRAGLAITLAGPVMDPAYFEAHVRPRLGPDVTYAGHLDHVALAQLVGSSAVALVTPRWDEPFGLVAAEAMACGTPVAAYARGGVPEVVTRSSGRLARADDVDDLARAVGEACDLDRSQVRRHAEADLGVGRMTDEYEALFRSTIAGAAA